jgi:hypothetical protein
MPKENASSISISACASLWKQVRDAQNEVGVDSVVRILVQVQEHVELQGPVQVEEVQVHVRVLGTGTRTDGSAAKGEKYRSRFQNIFTSTEYVTGSIFTPFCRISSTSNCTAEIYEERPAICTETTTFTAKDTHSVTVTSLQRNHQSYRTQICRLE